MGGHVRTKAKRKHKGSMGMAKVKAILFYLFHIFSFFLFSFFWGISVQGGTQAHRAMNETIDHTALSLPPSLPPSLPLLLSSFSLANLTDYHPLSFHLLLCPPTHYHLHLLFSSLPPFLPPSLPPCLPRYPSLYLSKRSSKA